MQNPFTTTFSKTPEYTYIPTEQPAEILENFSYDKPSESVYKITGVRGSGKTVILAKIEEELRSEESRQKGWIVLDLNPARDMLMQTAAMLQKEKLGKKSKRMNEINFSASVLGTGGGFGVSKEKENIFLDIGTEIEEMIQDAVDKRKKILICIDEISRTQEMVAFTSEYGRWLRAGYPVYLVCTGLYDNIRNLSNVKNLTFFRRAATIKTEPLSYIRMSEMYQKQLDVDSDSAKKMAAVTKGYAYAFQELGVLCFRNTGKESLQEIITDLKSELFAYSYEKIWEELTDEERFFVGLLKEKSEYSREEVLELMENKAGNYSVYRDILIKKGLLSARRGYISLSLPFFGDFIKEYGRYIP